MDSYPQLKAVKPQGVSVIICCYNSAFKLQPALEHLAIQKRKTYLPFEVILVDNNSSDDTSRKAMEIWNELKQPFPIIITEEKKAGLNFAREKGIKTAAYEYIVFCDDDNGLCENYLLTAASLLDCMPDVAVIGGAGTAILQGAVPEWFTYCKGFGYAVGNENRKTGFTDTVYGAGMIIRQSMLEAFKQNKISFLLTDRIGKNIASGGDTEICLLLKYSGQKIWFDEALTFKHYLPQDRINRKYYLKLRASFGKANAFLNLYNPHFKIPTRADSLEHLIRFSIRHAHLLLSARFNNKNKYADAVQQYHLLKTYFVENKKLVEQAQVAMKNIEVMKTAGHRH